MYNKLRRSLESSLLGCLKLILCSFLIFSCKPTAVVGQGGEGQADKVAEIQRQIEAYQAKIEPCKEGEPCGAFSNRNIVNEHSGPWPAVGIYQVDRTFWYHRIFIEEEGEYAYQLDMVLVKTKRSAREEREMVFFDAQGNLIYYQFQMGAVEAPTQHIQFYFEKGELLHFTSEIADEEKDYQRWKKDDAPGIRELGAWHKENFQLDMRER